MLIITGIYRTYIHCEQQQLTDRCWLLLIRLG